LDVKKYDSALKSYQELVKGGVPAKEMNLDIDFTPAIKDGFKSFPELAQHTFV
jgi:hypothetical protein